MSAALPARLRACSLAGLVALALLTILGTGASTAHAAGSGSWWHLSSVAAPNTLQPGVEAQIVASASNLGYEDTVGTVTISDDLPAGTELVPGSVHGSLPTKKTAIQRNTKADALSCDESKAPVVTCTAATPVAPYQVVELVATVKVTASAGATLHNEVSIQGGTQALPAPLVRAISVGSAPTVFGVANYELQPEDERGEIENQAGKHPFQLTTTLEMNQVLRVDPGAVEPVTSDPALVRDLHFVLPPGLLGNVNVLKQCSPIAFSTACSCCANSKQGRSASSMSMTAARCP